MSAPSQPSHPPEIPRETGRARLVWLLAAALLGLLFYLPEVLSRPLFGDDAFYIWGATLIHHGFYPIHDFFAIDPAGTWAYFCGVRALFGEGSMGYWGMVTLNVTVTAALLGLVARQMGGAAAGVWTAFLFALFQLRCLPAFELVGKDMLGFPFVLGGLLLAARSRWWIPAQLLVGVGLAIKPTLGAVWLVWMAADLWRFRDRLGWWLVRAAVAAVAIGLPFLAATEWAEQHGWGWAALKVNAGLRGNGYGAYFSGSTLYKLLHDILPAIWLSPLVVAGARGLWPGNAGKCQLLGALVAGGFVNWAIQPMFNSWYFVSFYGGLMVVAGMGVTRLLPRLSGQIAIMICAALFFAFVPATNLRWIKLLTDIHGKDRYTLADHQSRLMAEYALGNTPPIIQAWVRDEVARLTDHQGRVGVLVTDGSLLWALRDYRPGFWADWCPSWNPQQLADGVASGSADVLVSVEDLAGGTNANIYYDQVAKLRWEVPARALTALENQYQPVAEKFGYVIYVRRK